MLIFGHGAFQPTFLLFRIILQSLLAIFNDIFECEHMHEYEQLFYSIDEVSAQKSVYFTCEFAYAATGHKYYNDGMEFGFCVFSSMHPFCWVFFAWKRQHLVLSLHKLWVQ